MATKDLGKIGITFGGDWNASTTYEPLTFVHHRAAGYISKTTSKNVDPSIQPSAHWQKATGWVTGLKLQYSQDAEDWHDTYTAEDAYLRISTDDGYTWGEAIAFSQDISGKADKTEVNAALALKDNTDAVKLEEWQDEYGNLDLAVSSLTDLNAFILAVLSAQSSNNYTSIAPFQGVMVHVKAYPSDSLLALSWTWAGTHYALSRNSGVIVHHGIEDMYTPDYNIDFNNDFRI